MTAKLPRACMLIGCLEIFLFLRQLQAGTLH